MHSLFDTQVEERTKMNSSPSSRLAIILDKNLYGRSFLTTTFPYLIFGLTIQFIFYFSIASLHLMISYLPFYIGLVIVSGFATKNVLKEFHPMEFLSTILMLFVSAFSKIFALIAPFASIMFLPPLLQLLVVLGISESAFVVSTISVIVLGQRASLRGHVGLDNKFFQRERRKWRSELNGFPKLDDMLARLNEGRFVAGLFDNGFFNLTILWSCNVMERVIDAMTDGIISMNPETEATFRTDEGRSRRYSLQIEQLGYRSLPKGNRFNVKILWHRVRNDIAHRNYTPTFYETNETLKILVSFVRETPIILHKWRS
jgi:hypothetical protein